MDPDTPNEEQAEVSAAEETSTPDVTEGSESSSEAVEEQSIAEKTRDEFLKEYGGEDEPEEPEQEDPPEVEDPQDDQEIAAEKDSKEYSDERIPDEEFKKLPDSVRERIGYLSSQLRESNSKNAEMADIVEKSKADTAAVDALSDFTTRNNLSSDDVNKGMAMMAMLQNGDFQAFLDNVQPFYDMAAQATGRSVAPDVQKLVEDGELSEEAAIRVTKAEQAKAFAEAQAQRAQQIAQQQTQQQQQKDNVTALKQAIANTEASLKSTDPDFSLKEQTLKASLSAAVEHSRQSGTPLTPEGVVQLIQKLHAGIVVPKRPDPVPTPSRPSATSGTPRTTTPTTTLEAITGALTQVG